jgi:hypothetical protein
MLPSFSHSPFACAASQVNGNELCDTLTIGIGAGVEGSLLVVALCGVGDIATAVLQLEDMLVAGMCASCRCSGLVVLYILDVVPVSRGTQRGSY